MHTIRLTKYQGTNRIRSMATPVHYRLGGFPPKKDDIDFNRLSALAGSANLALGRYDGSLESIPNTDILLSPMVMHEAASSSRIEGTNITMSEAFRIGVGADENIEAAKRDDFEEVWNYREALNFSTQEIREGKPISLHLLRQMHELLMRGVRGHDKSPGAFRDRQNWIGRPGFGIENAEFVPIPQEHLQSGLERWMEYLRSTEEIDPLVQMAIIHFEFEAIHPFKDGNGRLGRMLIPLFLYQRGILGSANFYMSDYLEENREEYVDKMRAISRDGQWTGWCAFFLEGIVRQASISRRKAENIRDLHRKVQDQALTATRSPSCRKRGRVHLLQPLLSRPSIHLASGNTETDGAENSECFSQREDHRHIAPRQRPATGNPCLFVFVEYRRRKRDLLNTQGHDSQLDPIERGGEGRRSR
ncbi:Fic family protein [Thioalkalivibrio sp. HK1]|uniref:Fic family protein n=1 Tax=Thioalkalivibrio sp. HK1 TaxID=1469245 RepID=UPI0004B4CAA0|nr:Fic family protein [Thioalkalivibrio sp. HK1]